MIVIGKNYSTNASGERIATLHLADEFNDFYKNNEAGRGCEGQRVEAVYVGNYDVTAIKVGTNIEIYYGKSIKGKSGEFQPIKKIEIIK